MRRDEKILEAAEKLFYERSFDGVGVDEIGRLAGVSGSAIYRHFDSKDEILAVLFDHAIDALLMSVEATPGTDPHAELAGLVRTHVEFATTHHRLASIWSREQRSLAEAYRRGYQRRQRRYIDLWLDCLGRCYPNRSAAEIRTAMRGLQALLMADALRPPGSSRPSAEAQRLLTAIALSGVTALDGAVREPAS